VSSPSVVIPLCSKTSVYGHVVRTKFSAIRLIFALLRSRFYVFVDTIGKMIISFSFREFFELIVPRLLQTMPGDGSG